MVNAEFLLKNLPPKLRPVTDEQGANAAVTLLIKPKGDDCEILLVKRAKRSSNPWSGQMAIPGGKREPTDQTLKETAIRETMEETGINLTQSHFLGVLTAVQSVPRRDLLILPLVVLLENEPTVELNRNELDAYLWVPYEKIIKTQGKIVEPDYGEVSAYLLENAVVWGITYKILGDFNKIVEAFKKQ
jgi:8-oxo-dGTP pyrophosphatase MutT (NUDIX family)